MEELFFANFDAEAIRKSTRGSGFKKDFPTCCVGENNITFNSIATQAFAPNTKAIKWFINTNYVFAFPTDEKDRDGYLLTACGTNGYGSSVTFLPRRFVHEKHLKQGHRKVYKYKDGIAFSRYETID